MPPYKLRTHPRARHVRLRVDRFGQVVVTAPPGFDRRRVAAFVAERGEWIARVQGRFRRSRAGVDEGLRGARPERVELPAIAEGWAVEYRRLDRQVIGFEAGDGELRFKLPRDDAADLDERIAAKLRQWLMQRARSVLVPMTGELAQRYGYQPGRITIRNQRSRWGSCSARGNLSLNARLLLASPAACRYVLVHELVHLEHPDHSRRFWARVAEIEPEYRAASEELRDLWVQLPEWVG